MCERLFLLQSSEHALALTARYAAMQLGFRDLIGFKQLQVPENLTTHVHSLTAISRMQLLVHGKVPQGSGLWSLR